MSSEFGHALKVSVFGQSHGKAIGVVMDGLPGGFAIDMDRLGAFLDRRRPGKSPLSTHRNEADAPVFLSGVADGKTCASPLCAVIENTDARSKDYAELLDKPRPSHADYTAYVKYGGTADMRGGGHFSGRLTAPLCIAGGIALQLLDAMGVKIGAHIYSVGDVYDAPYPFPLSEDLLLSPGKKAFPVLNDAAGQAMQETIAQAAKDLDSVGGVVECAVVGLRPGLGDPMFEGMESRLASVLFGVPAVKGLEFGSGFAGSRRRGSENNDPFAIADGKIVTTKNDCGGILGGITTGMPLVFRCGLKPTPSIARPQQTVSLSKMEETTLSIKGRHDPCIALRAVPVIEAAAALVILDVILEESGNGNF